jgi:hypothetical protein
VQLAGKIDSDFINCEIAPLYSDQGRPGSDRQMRLSYERLPAGA